MTNGCNHLDTVPPSSVENATQCRSCTVAIPTPAKNNSSFSTENARDNFVASMVKIDDKLI